MAQDVTRSWFAVLSNPQDHGYEGTPQEICEQLRDEWVQDSTTRSGAWAYCISAAGLHHIHMVLEDTTAMRFSAIKKTYAIGAHLEPTRGSKRQAEDYICKRHPYAEKGEEVVRIVRAGTIMGAPGRRTDLETIGALLEDGLSPEEIMDTNFSYRRYERAIKGAFYRKRWKETPPEREVKVHLLVGDSGSGKTHKFIELCSEVGEDNICLVNDYALNGGMDHYGGERILFLDEFRGQYPYSVFLSMLDKYKVQVHARYCNVWALWSEVYITSVYSPEALYKMMVPLDRQDMDSREQMYRRITDISYCYVADGEYKRFTLPMSEYKGYDDLVNQAAPKIPPLFQF